MAVIEKVFYTEKNDVFNNGALKLVGFKYESASTLGINKEGYYLIVKANEDVFKKEDIKSALKDAEEITDDEKEKVLVKFREIEENAASGFAMFD